MYVNYCKNKPDSTQLILEHAGAYFDVSTKQSESYIIYINIIKGHTILCKYKFIYSDYTTLFVCISHSMWVFI